MRKNKPPKGFKSAALYQSVSPRGARGCNPGKDKAFGAPAMAKMTKCESTVVTGRNSKCSCGSGRKLKRCCL